MRQVPAHESFSASALGAAEAVARLGHPSYSRQYQQLPCAPSFQGKCLCVNLSHTHKTHLVLMLYRSSPRHQVPKVSSSSTLLHQQLPLSMTMGSGGGPQQTGCRPLLAIESAHGGGGGNSNEEQLQVSQSGLDCLRCLPCQTQPLHIVTVFGAARHVGALAVSQGHCTCIHWEVRSVSAHMNITTCECYRHLNVGRLAAMMTMAYWLVTPTIHIGNCAKCSDIPSIRVVLQSDCVLLRIVHRKC